MASNELPLVTIGIPTYNRASNFLEDAIQSAVKQTYENIEIIVSDNGSTDHTEDVVKGFSDSRIRYLKQIKNIGFNNNFNTCVEKALGDYFLLLCDDDLIDSDLVEVCMQAVNFDTNVGVILTGTRLIDEKAKVIWESHNTLKGGSVTDFFVGWFSDRLPLYLCSTLYNTKCLRDIGGFQSKAGCFNDVVATVKIIASNGKSDVYDVKASFRRHTDNRGGSIKKIDGWCDDSLYLLNIMCELTDDKKKKHVRHEGLRYFSRKNYRLASTIESPMLRKKTYLKIYKKFGFSYSPLQFLYGNSLFDPFRRCIRKLRM